MVTERRRKQILSLAEECSTEIFQIVEQFFNKNSSSQDLGNLHKELKDYETKIHPSIVLDAIIRDSIPTLEFCFSVTNLNVNDIVKEESRTLLTSAIGYNRKAIVEFLLKLGADIKKKDDFGETPLQCALDRGRIEIALFLTYQIYNVPLNDPMDLIKFLLNKFDDYYIFDRNTGLGFSSLLFFAYTIGKEAFQMVLSVSPVDHLYDKHPYFDDTMLNLIITWGNKTMLKLAIEHGVNLNYGSNFYDKPLYLATLYSTKMLPILVKNGARFHSITDENFQRHHVIPLRDFGTRKYHKIIQTMKKLGTDFYVKFFPNENELYDLCRFAGDDNCKIFLLALERGVNINQLSNDNYCLLKFVLKDDLLERYDKTPIIQILVAIIVRMMENKEFVSSENIECLSDKKIWRFHKNCKEEIVNLRKRKIIKNGRISYYDFLTNDLGKLTAFARNVDIRQEFRLRNYEKEFPIYEQHLKRNFERSLWRFRKMEKIYENFKNVKFPLLIFEKICGYLNDEELINSNCYFQLLTVYLLGKKIKFSS
ncbi:uncharacterized protein LOC122502646 [Leptopilina heterotoma]|uniref:uncharacterized protein LOC122502646 n=1 Tax=Leptopilina heterotoma TaxID=63436 RepID=UPI001CA81E9B|nr:uncharacterized protein LOC122502646 [Leptopilina heterotoma]